MGGNNNNNNNKNNTNFLSSYISSLESTLKQQQLQQQSQPPSQPQPQSLAPVLQSGQPKKYYSVQIAKRELPHFGVKPTMVTCFVMHADYFINYMVF